MSTRKPSTKKKVVKNTSDEDKLHEREPNLINAVDDNLDARIKPPSASATGTEAHHIRTTRGEEVGFYQIPQGGFFNNTNLKS